MSIRTILRMSAITLLCLGLAEATVANQEVVAVVPKDFPPLYQLDSEGRPSGSAIEVMTQLARHAQIRVRYIVRPDWESTMEALRQGEADIIPNLGVTPDRLVDFDFTNPLETLASGIFVRADARGIEGINDLAGVKTAVVKGNVALAWLRNHPRVKPVEFQNQEQALFALLSGEVDALIYPIDVTWRIAASIGVEKQIRQPGGPLVEIKRAVAVRKGNNSLLQRLDEAVRDYTRSEQFGSDYARLHPAPKATRTTERVFWYGIVGLGALLGVAATSLWRKGRRVAALEAELAKCRAALQRMDADPGREVD